MDSGYFYSGRDGEKEEEKKDIPTLHLLLSFSPSLPSFLLPSLYLTGESNMNMNATCVGINVGK